MTREEASRIFESIDELEGISMFYQGGGKADGLTIGDIKEACRMAIFAFRAQPAKLDRSRWKGCEMCTMKYTKQDWNTKDVSSHEFRVSGDSLMYCDQFYGWEGIRIKFCPSCSRPLTDEAWAELERRFGGNDETD